MLINHNCRLKGDSLQISRVFSLFLFLSPSVQISRVYSLHTHTSISSSSLSHWLCPVLYSTFSCPGLSESPSPSSQLRKPSDHYLDFPFLSTAWKLFQAVSGGSSRIHPVCFPSFRDPCPLPEPNVLKTIISHILSGVFL